MTLTFFKKYEPCKEKNVKRLCEYNFIYANPLARRHFKDYSERNVITLEF